MPKTSAERQATYRARRGVGTGRELRLNTWVSPAAHLALESIARHQGVSQRAVLERLILAEDEKIVGQLVRSSPEWDTYFRAK